MTNLDAALKYASLGWPVVPLHTPTGNPDQPCSCRKTECPQKGKHPCHSNACKDKGNHPCHQSVCGNIGKHPRTINGVDDATTDEAKIREWRDMWPDANVAIVAGKESGFFVLDVDPRNGGDKTLAELEAKHGTLSETRTQDTGSGGFHHLFKYPDFDVKNDSKGEMGLGLDIKSDRGFILAAPSLHASAKRYRWRNGAAIVDAPDWFLKLLKDISKKAKAKASEPVGDIINDGTRKTTLLSLAGSMRRRGMNAVEIEAALNVVNQNRCKPPLDNDEVHEIAASVEKYEPEDPVNASGGGLNSLNSLNSHSKQAEEEAAQWPDAPDEVAFYGLAGDYVQAIQPHTESDPVAILVQFLIAFGNLIGRRAHFVAEADKHFLNLFAVLVGLTAKGRKGSSWGQTKALLGSVDPDWLKKCATGGLSSGEGLIWAIRDPIIKHDPIKVKGVVTGYQDIVVDPGVDDKRLLVIEPEFAGVLKQGAREGNTLSPVMRRAWDDGNLKSMTKNSPACATDAHISVIGHITKDELRRELNTTEAANGFANRHLWLCVRRSKLLPEGGKMHELNVSELAKRLKAAVDFAKTVDEMTRDEAARELWFEVYEELSEGKPGLLGAITSRAEPQVMRLACAYALLDLSKIVQRPHLKAALALWKFSEDSARFIFGEAMGDPVADTIMAALKEAGDVGLTRWDITNRCLQRHTTASEISRALASLAEIGRARYIREETGGRPAERWFFLGATAKKAKKAKKGTPDSSYESKPCEESEESEESQQSTTYGNGSHVSDIFEPGSEGLSSLSSLSSQPDTEKNSTNGRLGQLELLDEEERESARVGDDVEVF